MARWRIMMLAMAVLAVWPSSAHGQADLVVEPGSHDFGALSVGQAATATFEVWNDGLADVTLERIRFDGPGGPFALGDAGCAVGLVLEPGSGCDLDVTFLAPAASGDHGAAVVVEGDGGTEPVHMPVAGSSYLPGHLVAEPGALDFGVVARGTTSQPQSIVVRNPGDTTVTFAPLYPIRHIGPRASMFRITPGSCVGGLAPGAACEIAVTFSPPKPFPPYVDGRRLDTLRPAPASVAEVTLAVYLHSGAVGLSVPLRGVAPAILGPPAPPRIEYGPIEQDLVRLAESVPRLLRGGPRRKLRLPELTAKVAGRLSLRIRGVGRQRRVRMASGALRLEAGASGGLRFSLTRRARKILRQPRRTPVRVLVAFREQATGEAFDQALELAVRRPVGDLVRKRRARR